jgi:ABC-type polysaccharide/polyol phosphate transport system ATPase subunit
VLLLDEVHEALDLEFREAIEGRVESILRDGGAVVAAGHDHELLSRLCDRAILLDDGALRADGPFEEVAAGHLV